MKYVIIKCLLTIGIFGSHLYFIQTLPTPTNLVVGIFLILLSGWVGSMAFTTYRDGKR